MRITLFTGNQPRHIALAHRLAAICDVLHCVQECNTVFPGEVDDFFRKSAVMQRYFANVMRAERQLFGNIAFSAGNVRTLSIKGGDLSRLGRETLSAALEADIHVVFGASYIRGWLADHLVSKGALNIHMGLSPWYRGSSCNFWALYDNNPSYVGATIHRLTKGLDSGPMLWHCVPVHGGEDPFVFTMRSVEIAQQSLVSRIASGEILEMEPQTQDRTLEIRYTRNADFTDQVAGDFLRRGIDLGTAEFRYPALLRPWFG